MFKVFPKISRSLLSVNNAFISTLAPYVRNKDRPLNIAHRGLSGIIPENTIPAFEAAMYSGADFIQLDVVFTQDDRLLVMHDPYLHRITSALPDQFPHAAQTRYYASQGQKYHTQWTDLLRLSELKSLRVKQAQVPGRISSLDYRFGFPTLEEAIECVKKFNKKHRGGRNLLGREVGIMIEAKDGDMYRQVRPGKPSIGSKILDVLQKYGIDSWEGSITYNCPIFLHSFDDFTVEEWSRFTNLPNHQLVQAATLPKKCPGGLVEYAYKLKDHCHGLGVQDTLLYDPISRRPYLDVIEEIKAMQMMLHVWTLKDDALPFGAANAIEAYDIGQNVLKLDGIITEFSDSYSYISHFLTQQEK